MTRTKRILVTVSAAALALSLGFCVGASRAYAGGYDLWNRSGFSLDHNFHLPFENIYRSYWQLHDYALYGRRQVYGGEPNSTQPPQGYEEDFKRDNFEVVTLDSERALQEANTRAIEKARAGQRACRPVVIYTDEGAFAHPADGCRR